MAGRERYVAAGDRYVAAADTATIGVTLAGFSLFFIFMSLLPAVGPDVMGLYTRINVLQVS